MRAYRRCTELSFLIFHTGVVKLIFIEKRLMINVLKNEIFESHYIVKLCL